MQRSKKAYLRWRDAAPGGSRSQPGIWRVSRDAEREIYDRFYRIWSLAPAACGGVLRSRQQPGNEHLHRPPGHPGIGQTLLRRSGMKRPQWPSPMTPASSPTCLPGQPPRCWLPTAFLSGSTGNDAHPPLSPMQCAIWASRAASSFTASHNPAKYNGYKVYGPDGCQIQPEVASAVPRSIGEDRYL